MEVEVEPSGPSCRTTTKASIMTSRTSEFEDGLDVGDRVDQAFPMSRRVSKDSTVQGTWSNFSTVNVHANYEDISLHATDDQRWHDRNWINQTWNLSVRGLRGLPPNWTSASTQEPQPSASRSSDCASNIPIETGTSTFYRHLCSEDDPPRSVSICPQRRCVAFGCSAGIELHWIDALTGQSLSR